MKKLLSIAVVLGAGVFFVNTVIAEEFATKNDAKGIVKKAIAHIRSVGIGKASEDFTNRKGEFVKLDLYVTLYNMQGIVLAHGQNKKSIGKDMMDLKDPDGKEFIKERMAWAQSKGTFWQEYKFTDPVTKKVLPKEMYCETVSKVVACAGVYKR